MYWYLKVIKNYAVFNGRARRKEFWMFFLFNYIFIAAAVILDRIAGTSIPGFFPYGLFYFIYLIPIIIPGLAVGVRRMHDVGKSGWFVIIPVYNIILLFTKGIQGENEYGADPKAIE